MANHRSELLRGDFEHYIRTGRRRRPLEVKFNPNHDPSNGQFTSGSGSSGRADRKGRERAAISSDGPFREAAMQPGAIGQLARDVNAFANGRSSRLTLALGSGAGNVDLTRSAGSVITVSGDQFTASGALSIIPGREEVRITLSEPKLKGIYALAKIQSFPSHVRIFQAISGNINYSLDRDLTIGLRATHVTPIKAGTYIFQRRGK